MLGHSIATIQKATGIRYERVIKTINFYEPNRVPPPSAKNGRPKKISNDALNRITVLTLQDRGIPCWLISKKLQDEGFNGLSTTTVWRERVNLGFEFKPPKIRQSLSVIQKKCRVDFAYAMLNCRLDLSKIIFSDDASLVIILSRKNRSNKKLNRFKTRTFFECKRVHFCEEKCRICILSPPFGF